MVALLALCLSQQPSNAAHEALDELERLRYPTSEVMEASPEAAAALGFTAPQAAQLQAGVRDAGLRLAALVLLELVAVSSGTVVTVRSLDSLRVGLVSGLIGGASSALLFALWSAHGGQAAIKAIELHNDALLTSARGRSAHPAVATALDQLLLFGVAGPRLTVRQGTALVGERRARLFEGRELWWSQFRAARTLETVSDVLFAVSFVPLVASPIAASFARNDTPAVVAVAIGATVTAVGALVAAILVARQALNHDIEVISAWNDELLARARASLSVRAPSVTPLEDTPEPPPSHLPSKSLLLPTEVPSAQ